jgi:DNA-binding NarL/FixJ family response regulator
VPVAVYVCDKTGIIQSYNKRAVELWGREPSPGDPAQRHCGSLLGVTSREREIVQLVAEGRSNKQATTTLGISVKTIEAHRANIMRKLQLRTVSDLVRYAIRNKIVQP